MFIWGGIYYFKFSYCLMIGKVWPGIKLVHIIIIGLQNVPFSGHLPLLCTVHIELYTHDTSGSQTCLVVAI